MPDIFEEIIKRDSTTQVVVSGGGASPTGTYFTIDNNLSEGDPSVIRGNIGLGTIATFDGDQNLGTTDEVTFDQANVNDAVDPTHAVNLRTLEDLTVPADRTLTFNGLDGITVDPNTQDLSEDRTWELSVDINDPIRFENGSIGIKDHGLNQRGVLNTSAQDIHGAKTFIDDLTANSDMILGNQASNTSHAVRADREITISSDVDSVITWQENAKNLVDDPTWVPSIANHGLNQRGVLSTQTQNIYGRKQFQSESQFTEDIFLDKGQRWDDENSFLQTTTYLGGFAGSGARLQNVDGDWNFTVDNITARKRFSVY